MFHFTSLPPLALYIHYPWCVRKCPYCDFNSHEIKQTGLDDSYVDALFADLEQDLPAIWGRRISSIFIGGGTPSLFRPEAVEKLLSGLRARLKLLHGCEITLEANPGTVEQGRFAEFRAAGINRLSIGIQSFDNEALRRLGRIHDRNEAVIGVEAARTAGFENINLDLMFGLPDQDLKDAHEDLEMAIALQPEHLSYYQLTIEPNTPFHHAPPPLPEEESLWQMQVQGQERLAEAGYLQYEVSAYAKEGYRCQHNLNYWTFGDYLGIGAGAHGKITHAPEQRIERIRKRRHPVDYLALAGTPECITGRTELTARDVVLEFMMNALRLSGGFESALFAERTGMAINVVEKQLEQAVEIGFLEWGVKTIRPTEKGRNYLNELLQLFMDDSVTL